MSEHAMIPGNNSEFIDSKHILQKYDNTEFKDDCYNATGIDVTSDFIEERIKNGMYKDCTFHGNRFQYTGAAGIMFHNCEMSDCLIEGTNMQFADFLDSQILYNNKEHKIQGCNFNQSSFYYTDLKNAYIVNSSISQTLFIHSKIEKCVFRHATLQDNKFQNTEIIDSSFIGCNMEYTEFINTHIQSSILPFHQIPYIYGGLACLTDPGNSVTVSSSMKNAPVLSGSEYLKLLSVFSKFYEEIGEYFPLINIYFFQNNIEAAIGKIDEALESYIKARQFRKLKAICKLTAQNDIFTRHELSELYFKIAEFYRRISLNSSEEYQFKLHIDEIKQILCDNDFNKASAMIALKTNLTYHDHQRIGNLIYILEECLHFCNVQEDSYDLDIRHNSDPLSFWIAVSSMDPNVVVMFLGMISSIATGNYTLIQTALGVCADTVTILTFIDLIKRAHTSNSKKLPTESQNVHELDFAKKMNHEIAEKNIKLSLSLGNFHINYEKKENYQTKH